MLVYSYSRTKLSSKKKKTKQNSGILNLDGSQFYWVKYFRQMWVHSSSFHWYKII